MYDSKETSSKYNKTDRHEFSETRQYAQDLHRFRLYKILPLNKESRHKFPSLTKEILVVDTDGKEGGSFFFFSYVLLLNISTTIQGRLHNQS